MNKARKLTFFIVAFSFQHGLLHMYILCIHTQTQGCANKNVTTGSPGPKKSDL